MSYRTSEGSEEDGRAQEKRTLGEFAVQSLYFEPAITEPTAPAYIPSRALSPYFCDLYNQRLAITAQVPPSRLCCMQCHHHLYKSLHDVPYFPCSLKPLEDRLHVLAPELDLHPPTINSSDNLPCPIVHVFVPGFARTEHL